MGKAKSSPGTVTLYATSGQSHVSYDGEQYMVGADGSVEVPAEAADILKGHGFTDEKPEQDEVEAGEGRSTLKPAKKK